MKVHITSNGTVLPDQYLYVLAGKFSQNTVVLGRQIWTALQSQTSSLVASPRYDSYSIPREHLSDAMSALAVGETSGYSAEASPTSSQNVQSAVPHYTTSGIQSYQLPSEYPRSLGYISSAIQEPCNDSTYSHYPLVESQGSSYVQPGYGSEHTVADGSGMPVESGDSSSVSRDYRVGNYTLQPAPYNYRSSYEPRG